jgi:alkylation response protein AidB-like acyl-CoA dehydrogenase
MDLSFTERERSFQHEVRGFMDEHLRPEWRGVADSSARQDLAVVLKWQRVLARKGWLTPAWPIQFGGCDWTPLQHYIFKSESSRLRAPKILQMSIGMVGPLICAFGTPAQQAYFLPRIVSGEDLWCQGFSEPGSGSDLASLKTIARLAGDTYVVSGQKIWTTYAHEATQMLCLLKTDPLASPVHAGISMLLIDMSSPGITVRPIRTIDGQHHFNQVFLDDVIVPVSCRLGEANKGWQYARFLLAHERTGIADVVATRGLIEEVAAVASAASCGDEALLDNADFGARLARLRVFLEALEIMELRIMDGIQRGRGRDIDVSMLKILGTELKQKILRLGTEALGTLATLEPGDGVPKHASGTGGHLVNDELFFRSASIFGGSNEIQRNIIAKALFRSESEF